MKTLLILIKNIINILKAKNHRLVITLMQAMWYNTVLYYTVLYDTVLMTQYCMLFKKHG